MGCIYYVLDYLYNEIKRYLTTGMTIFSSDPIYPKMINYLTEENYVSKAQNQFLNAQIKLRDKKGWWDFDKAKDRSARPEVEYLPGNGSHFFTYKEGSLMYMN
jgi:hypothetical protein